MKSFSQFWEEASGGDAEEQKQKRKASREGAMRKAKKMASLSKKFTQRQRQKMLAKQAEAEARLAQQRQSAEELKAKRLAQQEKSRHSARQTAQGATELVKGTAKLGGAAVRGVGRAIKKRKDKDQTGT